MSSRKRTSLFGMRNGKKAVFLLCVFMLGLISLAFADGSYGATIKGVKYNDLNGNGEWNEGEPFLANHDVMILSHETAESSETRTDANGEYSFNVAAGKYMIWSGIPEGWCQTAPVPGTGQVSDTANATNAGAEVINFGNVQSDDCTLEVYPACEYEDHDDDYWDKQVETIASGSWDDPTIWSTDQVPARGSHVVIGSGHSITVPSSKIDLGRSSGTLCINENAKIESLDNNPGQAPSRVEIYARSIENKGDIIGKNGPDGKCGAWRAVSGSSIELFTLMFQNRKSGMLTAGNGGDDLQQCKDPNAAFGGNGGNVEVYSQIAVNDGGVLHSGNGGKANGRHAAVKGGDGGVVRVFTNIFDADNPSTNQSGKFISGAGGDARGPNPIPGAGGALEIYMKEIGGTHQGAAGGRSVVDPIHLKAASDLMMFGADIVELFTNEGGTIDLTALSQSKALENGESPIRANKIIRIVTKSKDGQGGIVNLKGIQGKVFKAGEKVEIFADTILLDDGVTVNDLADAPSVVIGPGRLVYRMGISGEKEIFGSPGRTRMLYLDVLNKGPKQDSYKLTVSDTEGWALQFISDTLAIKGFNGTGFNSEKARLRVTMPNTPGVANLITVTATSQSDPEVSAKIYIVATVNPGDDSDKDGSPDVLDDFDNDPEEWVDTDKDGIGNNADTDDDNDGMTDGWEIEHGTDPLIPNEDVIPELPSPDDSVIISGSGEHKMFVSPNSSDPAGEMQVTQEADGSYRGSNGSTSVVVVPDADASGDTLTFTIGKNLTGTGEPSAIMVKENDDGSHTYKVPDSPEVAVKVNEDDSFEVTDAESPGTVLNGRADGDVTVTDDEYPGMVFTEDINGGQTVTDTEFSGMRALINNGIQIITDTAYPSLKAIVNEDGTYTVTDEESPDTTIVYNPTNETYVVTDTEFPGIVITFNKDGSYILTDEEGNCYDISHQKQRGLWKKLKKKAKRFVNKVSRVVKKVAGFVKKAAKFVGKVAKFVGKVASFVKKAAPIVSKVFRAIGTGAMFVGAIFPPLCPMACAISGFANKAAAISDAIGKYAEKVEDKAKEVREEAAKVEKKAGKVERIAAKIAEWTRKRSRKARKDDVPIFNADGCEMITLYKASGIIMDNDGNPVANAVVRLHDESESDTDDVIVKTDIGGSWEIIALYQGNYTVTASKDGHGLGTAEFSVEDENVSVSLSTLIDTDGDGVSDDEDAFPDDPSEWADTDKDGVGNNADTDDDNDGMPDAWELQHGLNPIADDASGDLDGDGHSNLEEYGADTDPADAGSHPSLLTNGLVACYPFNGSARDGSGNKNHGTAYGPILTTDRFGKADSAYSFDGVDDYILVPDDDTLDMSDGLTITAWIKSESTSGSRVIVSKWNDNTWDHSYIFKDHNYSDKLRMALSKGDHHNLADLEGANSIPLGSWIHVATTYDSDTLRIYFNGVQEMSLSAPGSINNSATALLIGAVYTGGVITEIFKGDIDDVRIYERALSEAEIQELYTCDCECSNDTFSAGVFTVEETGVVQTDWLYDGGMYKGELGIFSLRGMGDLEPGSDEFIAEAVRRVLSDSEEGHLVLSDLSEGARFSGSLGEPTNWNSGEYRGVRSFAMNPGDRFATMLVPNGTFATLAENPGTRNAYLRPLFSLVSSNPAYGMYLGQIADVSGMGMAFSYEDISADNSDRDYNDLIIQITGAGIDEVPSLDSLTGGSARARRERSNWFDWRAKTELGGVIMEHLDAQVLDPDTLWISADVNTDAQLLAYDPRGRVIGETGGHIPGATFGTDIDGYHFVSLPALDEGSYLFEIRAAKDESGILTVRKHQGEDTVLSEDIMPLELGPQQVFVSEVEVASSDDGLVIEPENPVEKISSAWNTCEGDEDYDPFFDLDGDGCITILDIMRVVSIQPAG